MSMNVTSSLFSEPNASLRATSAATTSSTTSTANSGSSQTSLSSLGATFMQLLVQELQNQDPTAPMDSTQMVGQMISLNQLDQVASINQLLTNTLGSGTTTSSTTAHATTTVQAAAQQAATLAGQQAVAGRNANTVQLPTLSSNLPLI